ncbi:DUF4430 domain-containing protein [Paenibacillus lignilyticus]|uniref:DUF4430 domain-containing protein n=1 Tax=Paenibacillus lignilyticus TaxID=1172615 RepID=A0ABS5CMB6_9BACL|nr:DUF4430 domain-containing protein [Paenibacillus lignilyticus]MBP3966970.1 DUF4430 domain-containing protein [Paenibacillus lignilyticus]
MKPNRTTFIAAAIVVVVLIIAFYSSGPSTTKKSERTTVQAATEMTDQAGEESAPTSPTPAAESESESTAASSTGQSEPVSAEDKSPALTDETEQAQEPATPDNGVIASSKPDQPVKPKPDSNSNSDTSAQTKPSTTPPRGATKPPSTDAKPPAIKPDAGKDPYQTDPVPEGKPAPVEPQKAEISDKAMTAYLSVSCAAILDHMDQLDAEKVELVPKDGVIFKSQKVTFYEGESVFNVLQREMKKNKIPMEFENTPLYNSAYIEGIHNLYEFDCGELSGWMYKVNGWFPNYGASRYQLKQGDIIEWVYTCDLGRDVGDTYDSAGGGKS